MNYNTQKSRIPFGTWSIFHGPSRVHIPSRGGFALVELLVAVVLFGLISTFVIVAYSRISGQLFLTTLAYEIGLSFREAQSYGVSVHQFKEVGQLVETFDVGYGVHFDSLDDRTYAFFSDKGGVAGDAQFNGEFGTAYNETGCLSTKECMSVVRLEKGNRVVKFCGVLFGDGGRDAVDSKKQEECNLNSLPNTNNVISFLDVTFLRPNPDAIITTSQTVAVRRKYKAARVYLLSPTGEKRVIEVVSTGQISIK